MLVTSQVLDEGHRRPGGKRQDHPLGERLETPVRATLGRIHPATHGRPPARAALRIITEDTMETYVSQRRREGVSA